MKIYKIQRFAAVSSALRNYFTMSPVTRPMLGTPDLDKILTILHELGLNNVEDIASYNAAISHLTVPATFLAYIPSLTDLMSNLDAQTVLNPYLRTINFIKVELANISAAAASATPSTVINPTPYAIPGAAAVIDADFKELAKLSSGGVINTTKALQHPMYEALFNKFSRNISTAADNLTLTNLAKAIRNDGLINIGVLIDGMKPYALGKPQGQMVSVAQQLVQDIMSHRFDTRVIQNLNQNYEIVKEKCLGFGVADPRELEAIKNKREVEKAKRLNNTSVKPVPDGGTPLPAPEPLEVAINLRDKDALLTNPNFLSALYAFFATYNKAIERLPN
jgi:hypothetical protein